MKHVMNKVILAAVVATSITSCAHNAITNRNQLSLYPESEIQSMAAQQYTQFLSENKVVSTSTNKDAEMVRRVGTRLVNAITQYYTQKGLAKELEGYKWEYNLVDSKEVNAWCMPGGKIVVYTGLLPISQNEAALAVVLGHEITHALAHHGNERMSQGALQQLGGVALQTALANKSAAAQNIFMSAYGVGSNVGVLLPFSRNQESEADHYGLIFTAMAGYNPQEAIPLWERMKAASGGNAPPQILSTHPSDDTRIAKLKELMPEAMTYYKPVK
ncbi:peptidase M48 [Niastella koreensis]|uniref:Peptidase M48 Ste24p n=2 Tax=Niastella koreensis TaxID=354356 RepID=G8TR58_NIAKG|nr:M48 family metallopeptidase [Niastella koreensis]AEV98972.1 peptidase M48 Ste24p [Niastella koreensis GR20-10]OQP43893.1 peptidase M48 [Niastella koreensis]